MSGVPWAGVGRTFVLLAVLTGTGCTNSGDRAFNGRSSAAEAFLHSVYGCMPERLSELASPDVAVSYPVFATLYNAQVIRGLDAVTAFSESFCRRWEDASITIDQVIEDRDHVVLVWSFGATNRVATDSSNARQRWGGISVFSFDDRGRVLTEVGEESSPGPTARMASPGTSSH